MSFTWTAWKRPHDKSVYRKGVFKIALRGIKIALEAGYRVTTNTTVFNGCDEDDMIEMFTLMTDMGIEGCMVSPGYQYDSVPNQELFLSRNKARGSSRTSSTRSARSVSTTTRSTWTSLRGKREYQCTAYANPTYTVSGWREPCYLPRRPPHSKRRGTLFDEELWERYGVGKDPRCASCMMHCGFESASIFQALNSPSDIITLVKEGAVRNSGVGAS